MLSLFFYLKYRTNELVYIKIVLQRIVIKEVQKMNYIGISTNYE